MRLGLLLSCSLFQGCFLAGCAGSEESASPPELAERAPPISPLRAPEPPPATTEIATEVSVFGFLRAKHDADGDGRIALAEYRRGAESFDRLDADRDGVVTAADFAPDSPARPFPPGFVYGEGGPELGDPAPDFRLPSTRGETIELASFRGAKPVVLVFGSFT